jgi:hypothetical protein
MQSSVTPFGMFCSNHFPGFRLVPVWLDINLSLTFPAFPAVRAWHLKTLAINELLTVIFRLQ